MKVDLKFEALEHIVRVYQERGENLMGDLAPAIAASLHAEVLEVFETEGYGKWPGFWWQRAGLPKPGTPKPRRPGKAPKALTARQVAIREKKAAKLKEQERKQRKFRAAFGFATGVTARRYAKDSLDRRKNSRKPAKSYRRWQGNPKLLQDTGVLIGSLTPFTAEDLVEVYTNVRYAKYHVSPAPRKKIPLRDFFAIDTQAFERDIVDMIDVHIGRPVPRAA